VGFRIAFARNSEDLQLGHFGHAEEFVIYDLGDEDATLIETRRNDRFCQAGPDEGALSSTVALLQDCRAVITAAAGPCSRQALEAIGVSAIEYEGTLDEALAQLVARGFAKRYLTQEQHR